MNFSSSSFNSKKSLTISSDLKARTRRSCTSSAPSWATPRFTSRKPRQRTTTSRRNSESEFELHPLFRFFITPRPSPRRFDSEVYAFQASITELKTARDRIQREKDRVLLEKNDVEKDLTVTSGQRPVIFEPVFNGFNDKQEKLDDIETLELKIKRLEEELEDTDKKDSDDRHMVSAVSCQICLRLNVWNIVSVVTLDGLYNKDYLPTHIDLKF